MLSAGRGLFLVVLVLAAAGPLYLLLKVSVSPSAKIMTPHPLLVPHAVTWRYWERVLEVSVALPVLVLSAFLQRYLRETNLAGAMREDRAGGKGSHSRFPARGRLLARDLCTHLASLGSSGVATDG
jgi:ABC-type glycerol-3-phosphate transport system permease component